VYISGAALRLARFNVNIGVVDKRFFQGLPSPAAAAIVIGLIWVVDDAGFKGVSGIPVLAWTAFAVTLYAGLSMVTNAPFYSFKVVGARRTVPFIVIVAIALSIAVVMLDPPRVLFAIFCAYGLSGYVVYGWRRMKGRPASVIATSTDEPDEQGLHR
jgi:CDP-diacylglycerol--serine O-phosphatidyltransferase